MALVVRYELNGKLHERFISFVSPQDHYAEGISNTIFEELVKLELNKVAGKGTAQSYDGAAVVSGKRTVLKQKLKPCTRMPSIYTCLLYTSRCV